MKHLLMRFVSHGIWIIPLFVSFMLPSNASAEVRRLMVLEFKSIEKHRAVAETMAEMVRNEAEEHTSVLGMTVHAEGERLMGRVISPDYVITGHLTRDESDWILRLRLMNTKTNQRLKGVALVKERKGYLRRAIGSETKKLLRPLLNTQSTTKKKKKSRASNPKRQKKAVKKNASFRGGSMMVIISGGEPGSFTLSGCISGRKRVRGKASRFSNVKANARCKIIMMGVSTTFKAKSKVSCAFRDGGSRLSCR